MTYLIQPFWEICLLQKAPQDIPYSRGLFIILLLIGLLVDNLNLNLALPKVEPGYIVLVVSVHTVFFLGSLSALMTVMGYAARIFQTLTALLGTGVIISLLAMPILLAINYITQEQGYFGLILLLLNIWSLVIMAHILRHALSVSFLLAGLFAFGYFMLSIKLVDFLLPATS